MSNKPNSNVEEWIKGDKAPNITKLTEEYEFTPDGEEVKLVSKDPNVVALRAANEKITDLSNQIAKVQEENKAL